MSNSPQKKPALGRGLGALLTNVDTDITSLTGATLGSISLLPISSIETNPFNPREHFEQEALEELANSIEEHGIIQPLTVRKLGRDKYQLISGERRFRAAQLAGLIEVPAYIRVANDQAMLEMALVENIQREDLNAIEVGLSYQRLIEECSLTQEQLGEKIAKSRSNVTNHLRLLKLPVTIQAGVRDRLISMGHARALVAVSDETEQLELFNQIVKENMSVRQLEQLLKKPTEKNSSLLTKNSTKLTSIQLIFLEELEKRIVAKVTIQKNKKGQGKLIVPFNSDDDFKRIVSLLNVE
ncbi:MAG: ParB/RepB/Spo0J family partition protein [Flavobacteriia bacterium]|nr:ParB/RepB/Spo0J family partition protein [Flavobacteriia bacterium]